jgi:hypothetical protein
MMSPLYLRNRTGQRGSRPVTDTHAARLGLRAAACLLALAQSALPAQAQDDVAGIHVHSVATSAVLAAMAPQQLEMMQATCKTLQALCAAGGGTDAALCAQAAKGFQFHGNLAEVGRIEFDEYYATAQHMRTRKHVSTALQSKSVCDVVVGQRELIDIWHYNARTTTLYHREDRPPKGRYWQRTDNAVLSPDSAAALLKMLQPWADPASVSPVTSHQKIAGHTCTQRQHSGAVAGATCLLQTEAAFPGHVALARSWVTPQGSMADEKATLVELHAMLPKALFYPPPGERVQGGRSASNPTQKWCARQKNQTGVNPCQDPDGDEGAKHE